MPVQPGQVLPTPVINNGCRDYSTEPIDGDSHHRVTSAIYDLQLTKKLVHSATSCNCHVLAGLIPPQSNHQHNLCPRTHNYQLPSKSPTLNDKHFVMRVL